MSSSADAASTARADLPFAGSICFYCADQNPHRDRSLGITSYTRGLLSGLAESPNAQLSAVTSTSSFPLVPGVREERLPFRTDSKPGRLLADHLHPWLTRTRAALWHYPKGFLPCVARVKGVTVCTVHDTILQHYADQYSHTRSRADFSYWLAVAKRSIARADAVVTVSEFSRTSILEFCDRHRLKPPPLFVTYQGIDLPQPAEPVTKSDYVLHFASTLPHKRTSWLCQTWKVLQQSSADLPMLVLVGAVDEPTASAISGMTGVTLRAAVERSEIPGLLAAARALLLPSEIEGFGLPALEAYAAGTPVAYVQGTAVEEVLGVATPGGFVFEQDSFRLALAEVLSLPESAITAKATELAAKFSWRRTVAATVAAYRSVAP